MFYTAVRRYFWRERVVFWTCIRDLVQNDLRNEAHLLYAILKLSQLDTVAELETLIEASNIYTIPLKRMKRATKAWHGRSANKN